MTTPVGDIIDSIATRVRDASNTAHSRTDVMDLISRAQMLINARFEYRLSYTALTTVPSQPLYSMENDLDATLQVNEVRLGTRSLSPIRPWRNLWKLSRTWLTDIHVQPQGWAQIGRTQLVIYPATVTPIDLVVTGVAVTPTYVDEAELMVLRPEHEDLVKDLVTALLLIKSRDTETAPAMLTRFIGRIQVQAPEIMEHERVMVAMR